MIEVNFDCLDVIEVRCRTKILWDHQQQSMKNVPPFARTVYPFNLSLSREANLAVDSLGRHSKGSMSIAWHEKPPNFLVSIYVKGCINMMI
jgi:hypothetical protein